ncbi:hypothetical protein JYU34_003260 [Plutella xylostella]|uniref:Uncharacterized protein n=1 Tax=Plutella xylostella TaxID=51655 RepID=A0ABQ7QZJ5_PLUXY|nr:hypothetical protein JYU34_003260 [Plutella xylostella]
MISDHMHKQENIKIQLKRKVSKVDACGSPVWMRRAFPTHIEFARCAAARPAARPAPAPPPPARNRRSTCVPRDTRRSRPRSPRRNNRNYDKQE